MNAKFAVQSTRPWFCRIDIRQMIIYLMKMVVLEPSQYIAFRPFVSNLRLVRCGIVNMTFLLLFVRSVDEELLSQWVQVFISEQRLMKWISRWCHASNINVLRIPYDCEHAFRWCQFWEVSIPSCLKSIMNIFRIEPVLVTRVSVVSAWVSTFRRATLPQRWQPPVTCSRK
jgi:hypothetical protein